MKLRPESFKFLKDGFLEEENIEMVKGIETATILMFLK
jgi:hypothetical protein